MDKYLAAKGQLMSEYGEIIWQMLLNIKQTLLKIIYAPIVQI